MIELKDWKFIKEIQPRYLYESWIFTLEDYLYINSMKIKDNYMKNHMRAKRRKHKMKESLKTLVSQINFIKEKYE